MFNYKLVHRDTGEIATYGDDNTIKFGGSWGERDELGALYVWVENTPTQAEIDVQHNETIKAQIIDLEQLQHRALREIVLSNPDLLTSGNSSAVQKLQDIEGQIETLRVQLK